MQFIKGLDEPSVPDVKLTRSKDGSSGTATFIFEAPTVFESSEERGDITGLYMVDDEGEISTVDVAAKFVNGKPDRIEAKYIMRSAFEWDRFMRYMERYAEQQGLGFQKVCVNSVLTCNLKTAKQGMLFTIARLHAFSFECVGTKIAVIPWHS